MPVMLHSLDSEGRIKLVSERWLEVLGYRRQEVIGKKLNQLINPTPDNSNVSKPGDFCLTPSRDIPCRVSCSSGDKIHVLMSITVDYDVDGNIRQAVGVMVDISELKLAQASVHKYVRVVEQSSSAMVILDLDFRIEYANPHFSKMTGYSMNEVLGKRPYVLSKRNKTDSLAVKVTETLNRGETWTGNIYDQRKSGERFWTRVTISPIVSDTGESIHHLMVSEDITSEILLRQRVAESDKLSAIGLLAAGVAHEFKNYLCGIVGNASLSLDSHDQLPEEINDNLREIMVISDRADAMASSLLSYSRADSSRRQKTDLTELVKNTLTLIIKEMRKSNIEMVTYFEDIPPITLYAARIQQLLLNLLINARDAIRVNGVITVALIRQEDTVLLKVGDTGHGVPRRMMSRLFDPFFSTKGVWGEDDASGSGMGLAICRNIAREHKGEIAVDSIVSGGTVFSVTLPIDDQPFMNQVSATELNKALKTILFSRDKALVGYYFANAEQFGARLYWMHSLNALTGDEYPEVDLMVVDGVDLCEKEFETINSISMSVNIPMVLINSDKVPWEIKTRVADDKIFDGLPGFDQITKSVGYRKPRVSFVN